ncbi:hypothetical protein [Chryseobacterium sp. SIMBA_029]|uniref:hypothetical protein n=1 Tax=Chryseobacterium sp. SIMBA_029 TaxID=3085772 RepID=UPI00397B8AF2
MKELHIISFNYPYPPTYGGIIDVYYKIKALSELGTIIHLHCFVDKIPQKVDDEIKSLVGNIFFYEKKKNPMLYFSRKPFAAAIRNSETLLKNLTTYKAPLLFEGLQTTAVINYLKDRGFKLYLRLHNNESAYYKGLAKSEKNILKKIIYTLESFKFHHYQNKLLKKFNAVFCLSQKEYMETSNLSANAVLVHLFHGNEVVKNLDKKGDYFLFHGDLTTSDNKKALDETILLFKSLPGYPLIVASDRANESIKKKINKIENIRLVPIGNDDNLHRLFENAHANILLSYQNSGTKVKLFNALYNSRFVIINPNITDDKDLINLCSYGSTIEEIRAHIMMLAEQNYNLTAERKEILQQNYSDKAKAKEIAAVIFKD